MSQNETLRAALQELLDMYLAGANSGDWGNWDVESEPQVIAARAALVQPAAPVVERADSAPPVVERGAGNVSDNAAPVAHAEPTSKPVARLLVWHGPKHLPVPPPAARTYAEFSEDSAGPQKQGAYWHNGTPLYAAPQPAPARVPLTGAEIASMQRRANTTGVQFLQPSTVRWIVRATEAAHGITTQGEPK